MDRCKVCSIAQFNGWCHDVQRGAEPQSYCCLVELCEKAGCVDVGDECVCSLGVSKDRSGVDTELGGRRDALSDKSKQFK